LRARACEVFRASAGYHIHYRLLDATVAELSPVSANDSAGGQSIAGDDTPFGFRGCRWGIITNFYESQMRVVRDAITLSGAAAAGTKITIVVPLLSTAMELVRCRETFDKVFGAGALREVCDLGCMIETPRSALTIARIAPLASSLCIGTNDLTQATWALSRNSGTAIIDAYLAHGIVRENPFVELDEDGVGKVLRTTIREAKESAPHVRILICGEQAAEPATIRLTLAAGADGISCGKARLDQAMLATLQYYATQGGRPSVQVASMPTSRQVGKGFERQIAAAVSIGDIATGHELAHQWAEHTARIARIEVTRHWKFFKRDLVASYFGRLEHRRFSPGWTSAAVFRYACSLRLQGLDVRYSLFPADIASHSKSATLPSSGTLRDLRRLIAGLDHTCSIEVFPPQGDSLPCFRALSSRDGTGFEIGVGQAMYVFEEERGKHSTVFAVVKPDGSVQVRSEARPDSKMKKLSATARAFLDAHAGELVPRLQAMRWELGLEWLGIEGYYAPETTVPLRICDADLPMDIAFQVRPPRAST
jgi:hypothetical protein